MTRPRSGPVHLPAQPDRPRRRGALLGSVLVVAGLAVVNTTKHLLPSATLWLSVGAVVALVVLARTSGLSWSQLGLGRHRLRAGVLWAAGAILVVAAVYVAGVLIPVTRTAFLDTRYHLGVIDALQTAFVVIPIGTVLLEEVAFRSVLWAMLSRHMSTRRVLLVSSALFGVWHVLPSLHLASANRGLSDLLPSAGVASTVAVVVGTVALTAFGGLVAGELRRRSGSVLASAGMHWATNALGVLFGLVAWRLVA